MNILILTPRIEWRDYDALVEHWEPIYRDVPPLFVEPFLRELEAQGYDRDVSIDLEKAA